MPATHGLKIELTGKGDYKADLTFGATPDALLVDPTADVPELSLEERQCIKDVLRDIARLHIITGDITMLRVKVKE